MKDLALVMLVLPLLLVVSLVPRLQSGRAKAARGSDRIAIREAGQMLRSRVFWWVLSMQLIAGVGYMGIYFHVVPYLSDVGYSPASGALIYGASGGASMVGFLLFGMLADRIGAVRALGLGIAICAIATVLLLAAGSNSLGLGAALVFAAFWGATYNLPLQLGPVILAESVSSRHLALALGISSLASGLGSSAGPILTGTIHDITGSYTLAIEACSAITLSALLPLGLIWFRGARQALTPLSPSDVASAT